MIRVRVVARTAVARAGLEAILARGEGLRLLRDDEPTAPDVILVDSDATVADVLGEAGGEPTSGTPAVVVLVDDPEGAYAPLRAGAHGVLPAAASEEELRGAIAAAAAGLAVLPRDVVERLLPAPPDTIALDEPAVALTAREREVLDALAEGLSNKGVARRLGISEHTVKAHVTTIFEKLHVSTRTEAVTAGVRLGLVLL